MDGLTLAETTWPDVAALAQEEITARLAVPTGSATPADLHTSLPFVRVVYGPGSMPQDHVLSVLVDLDAFASTVEASRAVAWDAADALTELAARMTGSWFVDAVEVATTPTYLSYKTPGVERHVASVRFTCRRQRP